MISYRLARITVFLIVLIVITYFIFHYKTANKIACFYLFIFVIFMYTLARHYPLYKLFHFTLLSIFILLMYLVFDDYKFKNSALQWAYINFKKFINKNELRSFNFFLLKYIILYSLIYFFVNIETILNITYFYPKLYVITEELIMEYIRPIYVYGVIPATVVLTDDFFRLTGYQINNFLTILMVFIVLWILKYRRGFKYYCIIACILSLYYAIFISWMSLIYLPVVMFLIIIGWTIIYYLFKK